MVNGIVLAAALLGCWLALDLAHILWITGEEEDSVIWPAFALLLLPFAAAFAWEAWRRLRALRSGFW